MEVSGQLHAPAVLPPGKEPDTHWKGGWVGLRVVLDAVYIWDREHKIEAQNRYGQPDLPMVLRNFGILTHHQNSGPRKPRLQTCSPQKHVESLFEMLTVAYNQRSWVTYKPIKQTTCYSMRRHCYRFIQHCKILTAPPWILHLIPSEVMYRFHRKAWAVTGCEGGGWRGVSASVGRSVWILLVNFSVLDLKWSLLQFLSACLLGQAPCSWGIVSPWPNKQTDVLWGVLRSAKIK
jgi:hypothetical protein